MDNKQNHKRLLDINKVIKTSQVGKGMKIADLGCGQFGFFVFPLAQAVGKDGTIYAIDILKNNLQSIIKRAKSDNLKQVKSIWSNLEVFRGTKIESNSLDMAFLINTLHQSSKRIEIIREAFRLLKKNGQLVIIDWEDNALSMGPGTSKLINKEALKARAKNLGFNIHHEFKPSSNYFGLILRKL